MKRGFHPVLSPPSELVSLGRPPCKILFHKEKGWLPTPEEKWLHMFAHLAQAADVNLLTIIVARDVDASQSLPAGDAKRDDGRRSPSPKALSSIANGPVKLSPFNPWLISRLSTLQHGILSFLPTCRKFA
jgi:hypothetical protein